MASYQPEVIPGSPQGQALQAAIQKQLAFHGWSTEDDTVMAEYCLVMLGNRKTAEQISTELSDLIGGDFDPSFTTWLFKELSVHYPDPSSAPAPSSSSTANASPNGSSGLSIAGGARGGAGQNGSRAVFGQAMGGVKRDSRELGGEPERQRAKYERPNQYDGIPNGPRNGRGGGPGQGQNQGGRGNRGRGGNGPGGNIFDRVGGQGNMDQMQNTLDLSRGGPSFNNNGGGNNPNFPSPQMMAQAQAQAMAFAALAAQQWSAQNGGQMPPGFNPAAFMGMGGPGGPGFGGQGMQQGHHQGGPGGGGRGGRGGFGGAGGRGGHHQSQGPPAPPQAPLPTKPLQEAICKHATECTKPACPFSHPSPAATKESGLVLSSEACEKGLECEDKDCPKSHVSKAQKNPSAHTPSATPTPAPAAPVVDPTTIPGAGEKMCKFAGSCTRKGCVFLHPWDQRETGGTVQCRWGEQCTRADCHFAHPPSRINYYLASKAAKKGGAAAGAGIAPSKYSAVFNKPSPTPSSGIGAWPSEDKDHVSERLKRFNVGDEKEGGGEKIIPGAGNGTEGAQKDEKVEILLEEEKKE